MALYALNTSAITANGDGVWTDIPAGKYQIVTEGTLDTAILNLVNRGVKDPSNEIVITRNGNPLNISAAEVEREISVYDGCEIKYSVVSCSGSTSFHVSLVKLPDWM